MSDISDGTVIDSIVLKKKDIAVTLTGIIAVV